MYLCIICYLHHVYRPIWVYYRRYVVLSNTPLKEAFKYKDSFVLQPITRKNIPTSPYAKHHPSFLDFYVESDKPLNESDLLVYDINRTHEICTILTALSNFRFFTYDSSLMSWGVVAPSILVEKMTDEEKNKMNEDAKTSIWMPFASYSYNEFAIDRIISSIDLLEGNKEMILDTNPLYFTYNPIPEEKDRVTFPSKIDKVLDEYYALDDETRRIVYSAMKLISDGIELGMNHQSLGFISYISAIETMVGLENRNAKVEYCKSCGQPIYSVRRKFLTFLAKYVSRTESSRKKFGDLYALRSKIAHTGKLFLSDVEFSFLNKDIDQNDWIKYLEVQQLARISLFRWLLLSNRYSH